MSNRQVERTKGLLRHALLGLLREKPFNRITVVEVVERAQVSKNSFYNHYQDLAELVQDCYLQQIVYFGPTSKRRGDYASREEAVTELLDQRAAVLYALKQNPNFARVVLSNAGVTPYFSDCTRAEEYLTIDHLLFEYGGMTPVADYLDNASCAHFITAGYYGMLRTWFAEGMVEDVETVVKRGTHYSLQCAAGMVGRPIEPEYLRAIAAWHYASEGGAGAAV